MDKKIALEMVMFKGTSLAHVSDLNKHDFDVVLAAVKQNGLALQYAPGWLQHNQTILITAYLQDQESIQFAPKRSKVLFNQYSEELKNTHAFFDYLERMEQVPWVAELVPYSLWNNPHFVELALKISPLFIHFASERLRDELANG